MAGRLCLSDDDVRALRLRAQGLAGARPGDVLSAVSGVGAIQAQAPAAARLAVRARTTGLSAADVDRACGIERTVVRSWVMRGTLHMVPTVDLHWMVGLLGPIFAKAGRRRREQLGLDDHTCQRALAAIEKVLVSSLPLTRAELVARITEQGVSINPRGQAPAHLVGYAAMRGLICRGPEVERDEPTYVLTREWVAGPTSPVPGSPVPDDPMVELLRRYLGGQAPAGVADFAAWSGLSLGQAGKAFGRLRDELVPVDAGNRAFWAPAAMDLAPPPRCPARLLGHFDAYLLGYRRRDLILDDRYAKRIQAGGGMIRPSVLVGGRVVGTWSLDRSIRVARVIVEPFEVIGRGDRAELAAEADDIGRFLGIEVRLDVLPSS